MPPATPAAPMSNEALMERIAALEEQAAARAKEDEDDGLIGRQLRRVFGKSWRTSLSGILGAGCMIAPQLGDALPPIIASIASIAGPLLIGGGMLYAKDKSVSGHNR